MTKTPLEQQEKRFGDRRHRLTKLLGLVFFITLAVIVLALWAHRRRGSEVVKTPAVLPQDVNRRVSAETYTHYEAGREVFRIHAARTESFGKGALMELQGVHVVIHGREGTQRDEISTALCRYNNETNALACSGAASIELASVGGMVPRSSLRERQPLFLETSDVSYDAAAFTIATRKDVQFHYGPASGYAVGLTYDTHTGRLALGRDVLVRLPSAANRTARNASAELWAGGLVYDNRSGLIALSAPVRFAQGSSRNATAAGATISLDAQHRATRLVLTDARGWEVLGSGILNGGAHRVQLDLDPRTSQIRRLWALGSVDVEERVPPERSGGMATSRRLVARNLTLLCAGTSSRATSGEARGDVVLTFRPEQPADRTHPLSKSSGEGKRILTTPDLVFDFHPNGAVAEAHTRGPGKLDLLPLNREGDRETLTAGTLRMQFDNAGRLETIAGLASAHVIDQPGASPARASGTSGLAPERRTSSDRLLAKLDPASGKLVSLDQQGKFSFQQGATRAAADRAIYRSSDQHLELFGSPEAWDPEGRIRAPHLVLNLATGIAHAWGGVQSIDYATPAGEPNAKKPPTTMEPLICVADQMTADRHDQHAHYSGHVRAWRGADLLEAPSLDVYRDGGRVVASQGVFTSFSDPSLAAPGSRTAKHAAQPSAAQSLTVRSDRLVYFNPNREALYEGNVVMISADSVLHSNRLRVDFSGDSSGATVEKAVADGSVRVSEGPSRRASAAHAEYLASTGEITLTGGRPIVYDQERGVLIGNRLTFSTRDASLLADGGGRSRTLSKHPVHRQ